MATTSRHAVDALARATGHRLGCTPDVVEYLQQLLGAHWEPSPAPMTTPDSFVDAARELEHPRAWVFIAVHHGNFPNLEYVAKWARARGDAVLGIYLRTPPPRDAFTLSYDCEGSLARLLAVLEGLASASGSTERAVWYLQAHGRWSFLSALIAEAIPGARIVQELWDWMELFVPAEAEPHFVADAIFSTHELGLMRAAERHARDHCAGLLHKNEGPALDRLLADARAPSMSFLPCPPRAWMRPPRARVLHKPPRLVHAGQLKGRAASQAAFGDIKYHPLVERLCAQGLVVHAYGSATPNGQRSEEFHADYHELARGVDNFTFYDYREVSRLIDDLSGQYDFGLLLYDFPAELRVGREHLDTTIASKLFTYLAAGLPVLVSPELRRMAAFVDREQIGLVVPASKIDCLAETLADCDYAQLCANVTQAQTRFNLECFGDQLLTFLDRCRHL